VLTLALRVIALASQLGHLPGVFAVIAAIILSIRVRAVAGWMLAFLLLCHLLSFVALVRDAAAR